MKHHFQITLAFSPFYNSRLLGKCYSYIWAGGVARNWEIRFQWILKYISHHKLVLFLIFNHRDRVLTLSNTGTSVFGLPLYNKMKSSFLVEGKRNFNFWMIKTSSHIKSLFYFCWRERCRKNSIFNMYKMKTSVTMPPYQPWRNGHSNVCFIVPLPLDPFFILIWIFSFLLNLFYFACKQCCSCILGAPTNIAMWEKYIALKSRHQKMCGKVWPPLLTTTTTDRLSSHFTLVVKRNTLFIQSPGNPRLTQKS